MGAQEMFVMSFLWLETKHGLECIPYFGVTFLCPVVSLALGVSRARSINRMGFWFWGGGEGHN